MAATEGRVLEGAFLLSVFSLGLAIPFLISAFFFGQALMTIKRFGSYLAILYKVSGLLLIGLGILLFTNNFDILIQWGFRVLGFLNYEEILFKFL